MKANELRIGNYVEPAEPEYKGQYFKVQSGDIKHIQDGSKLYKYKSIPFTPEILEKAGFVRSDDDYGGWLSKEILRQQPHTVSQLRIREDSLGFYYDNTFTTRITSLHQLQNLYFALTGEELPIEL